MNALSQISSKRFEFALASEEDDPQLRALLRRNIVPGSISVTFEREPNFFAAAKLQGPFHQVGVLRDTCLDRIIGIGTRSIADGFINGHPAPLGYLSDLRLDAGYRNGTLLARGYRMLAELHRDGRTPIYFTVVFADNQVALQTITAGRGGLPTYIDYGRLHCPGINIRRRKADIPFDGEIVRGNAKLLQQIVDCLNRNNAQKQFAPVHSCDDFAEEGRWNGFRIEDFYVALRFGTVVGVIGKWDLRSSKQTRVAGYRGPLRWLYRLLRHRLPWGIPSLPPVGSVLPFFYGSFIAVDHDDLNVFRALLRRLYNDAVGSEYLYFLTGLHERNTLRSVLSDYTLTNFWGRLFCVCYEDGTQYAAQLDQRCPHIELAAL